MTQEFNVSLLHPSARATLQFASHSPAMLTADEDSCTLPAQPRSIFLTRVGQWLVQQRGNTMQLAAVSPQASPLRITPAPGVVMDLQLQQHEVKQAAVITLNPSGVVRIETGTASESPVTPAPQPAPAPAPQAEEIARLQREIERLRMQVSRISLLEPRAARTERAERELEELRRACQVTQEQLLQQLRSDANALHALSAEQQAESARLVHNLDQLRASTAQDKQRLEQLRSDWMSAQEARDALSRELARYTESHLFSRPELADLSQADLHVISERLVEIYQQVLDDESVTHLLQSDPLLGGKNLSTVLHEMQDTLEAAERRMKLLIRTRERIDATIQQAVSGMSDAMLSGSEEVGQHGSN